MDNAVTSTSPASKQPSNDLKAADNQADTQDSKLSLKEDAFNEADVEEDNEEERLPPPVVPEKPATTMDNIIAQQRVFENEYYELASQLAKCLEVRVSQTLTEVDSEDKDGSVQSSLLQKPNLDKITKLMSYKLMAIRGSTHSEAVSVWCDFYKKKSELKDSMCSKIMHDSSFLVSEQEGGIVKRKTNIPVMDWISMNLDTVHYLRDSPILAPLDKNEIVRDFKTISGANDPREPSSPPVTHIHNDSSTAVSEKLVNYAEDMEDIEVDVNEESNEARNKDVNIKEETSVSNLDANTEVIQGEISSENGLTRLSRSNSVSSSYSAQTDQKLGQNKTKRVTKHNKYVNEHERKRKQYETELNMTIKKRVEEMAHRDMARREHERQVAQSKQIREQTELERRQREAGIMSVVGIDGQANTQGLPVPEGSANSVNEFTSQPSPVKRGSNASLASVRHKRASSSFSATSVQNADRSSSPNPSPKPNSNVVLSQ
ncbi:hypothetical protein DASB73_020060 [Starmerella bacillaris]|uniref:Uncharacterized protein n=1 Tax=Starmerella bacillaris TaxID=1247836 RepID=A0AAV5RHX2_STABA|nr:hypothetical protein DASB73_020060 [Starmerella bacillaris]